MQAAGRKYDVGFELRWNENECYRMAYRNCITELKYLTKMGKGSSDDKSNDKAKSILYTA